MQFFILLVGVMVFVFYQFNPSPLNFNPKASSVIKSSSFNDAYQVLEQQHIDIEQRKKILLIDGIQANEIDEIKALNEQDAALKKASKDIITKIDETSVEKIESNDKDYVFIHFILNNLPIGIIGLLLAVILSAAMSSTASELNALANTTVIDLYKRTQKTPKSENTLRTCVPSGLPYFGVFWQLWWLVSLIYLTTLFS